MNRRTIRSILSLGNIFILEYGLFDNSACDFRIVEQVPEDFNNPNNWRCPAEKICTVILIMRIFMTDNEPFLN